MPAGAGGGIPTVLYRKPGLTVTVNEFVVGGRRYPMRALNRPRTARSAPDPLAARIVLISAVAWTSVAVGLGFRGLDRMGLASYLALAAGAGVPVVLAGLLRRLRPPDHELWADVQGQPTLLFRTDEEHQFGQVTRALIRAREAAESGAVGKPLADSAVWQPPAR
ncbi:DUF6232 family protein [Plantactinospora sp. GCM10030261]|uniref:DUF6232 family protein n=1 Tax=Plantactinospora sp. GCM10030261 TaxID=3273420 RepID=UPI003615080B